MKKLLMIMVLACTFSIAANAQFYFGGTAGLSYSHFTLGEEPENKAGNVSFKFMPEIGYGFNDKIGAGIVLGYVRGLSALGSFDSSDMKGFISAVTSTGGDLICSDMGSDMKVGAFRLAPYFRWTFYRIGKLELFLDAVLGLNFGNIKTVEAGVVNKQGFTSVEITARPGLAFALSDNVKLVAKLGGFGYQYAGINDVVTSLNRFGLDADPANLMFGVTFNMKHRLGRR